jgi:hypothetical protein
MRRKHLADEGAVGFHQLPPSGVGSVWWLWVVMPTPGNWRPRFIVD